MKFNRCIAIICAIFLIALSGLASADILPNAVPENQVFTVTSVVDAVGAVSESTSTVWEIGTKGLDALPPAVAVADNGSIRSGSIAYATYSDFIMSNGGQISEVKGFSMDTHAKTAGLYNIETKKVLTYTSQNGSHLMGEESFVLDVAGNWSRGLDDIVCVFSKAKRDITPAFCNRVTASSKLRSINTAQIETIGSMTAVAAKSNVPAALNYEISVTPDANSASGYADGIISTTFTVSIMEGRSDGDMFNASSYEKVPPAGYKKDTLFWLNNYAELASTLSYIDTATVAGGISTFNKAFNYQSGTACPSC